MERMQGWKDLFFVLGCEGGFDKSNGASNSTTFAMCCFNITKSFCKLKPYGLSVLVESTRGKAQNPLAL